MRVQLSILVLSVTLLGMAGVTVAQPCEPRCFTTSTDDIDEPGEAASSTVSLAPIAVALVALTLRRRR